MVAGRNSGMRSTSLSFGDMNEITDEKIMAIVDKRVRQIELSYDKRVKEMKPYLFDMASSFVKEQAQAVTQLLTK